MSIKRFNPTCAAARVCCIMSTCGHTRVNLIVRQWRFLVALQKRGKFRYGQSQSDIRDELLRYSKSNAYLAHHFADAVCVCGATKFRLSIDDSEGAAVRTCVACKMEHPIGDSNEYLDEADLEECSCPCSNEEFEITVGVSLYEGSDDVKWLYLGCRCPKCGLTATYGDWKNEYIGYQELLARV